MVDRKINKISFYDFDRTIISSIEEDEGKILWKEKTGEDYPHIGWWSKAESLSLEVFHIQPISFVLNQFNNEADTTLKVLLTNRVEKVKEQVHTILAHHNIIFDEVTFKVGKNNKGQRIDEFLKIYKNIYEVDFYDDTAEHFDHCKFLIDKYNHINFNLYHVKSDKFIRHKHTPF